VGAVEAIRQHDHINPILIIADEPHHVYSRPLITYLLGGSVEESDMYYRPRDFYERHRVEAMLGVKVSQIHPQSHSLSLQGGDAVTYGRLLVATGGKPISPPVPGSELGGVFTLTAWRDALAIEQHIEAHQARAAVVVGGGMIGIKTTEALLARGIAVTVVELAERVLSSGLDHTASTLAEAALDHAGVRVCTGTTVKHIVGHDGQVTHAVLRDGEQVQTDMVVFAIGVRPNTSLIPPEAGIQVEQGICVDAQMRTTAPDVHAAGDCADSSDMLLGVRRPIAIWPNAYRQGFVAGCNMAGVDTEHEGSLSMNSIDVCGLPTISVGLGDPDDVDDGAYEVMAECDREALLYKKLVLRDQRLVGLILVGAIDRAGIYTALIRNRVPVTAFRVHLLSGSFGLISLPQDYRDHLVDEATVAQ